MTTFTKFGVTFDEAFITVKSRLDHYPCQPTRRIIFPCENFYLARLADKIEAYPEFARKFIKPKYNASSVKIFNVAAIDEAPAGSVIYAVEGIFDALSLLQIGAEGVVAINGAPHLKKLVDRIKTRAASTETANTEENRTDSATDFQDESAYFVQDFDKDV